MSKGYLASISMFCLIVSMFLTGAVTAQSAHCYIKTENTFQLNSQPRYSEANQSKTYYERIPWTELGQLKLNDNQCTKTYLAAGKKSEALLLDHFNFDVPDNAIVTGITARFFGSKEENGLVRDLNIRLTDASGRTTGNNKANKAIKGNPFNQQSSIYKYWEYGSAWDDWGVELSPGMVNSASFGISIEMFNNSMSAVLLKLDQVVLTVYYEAPISLCSDDNYIALHADPDYNVKEYNWQIPAGLNYDPVETFPYLVSILTEGSVYGSYEICLERVYHTGMSETCCTAFDYVNCEKGSIGDFVWRDSNGNGIQDGDEKGLDDRTLYLYNESMQELERTITRNGHYLFDDLDPGRYIIRVEVPELESSPTIQGNDALNSDFFEFLGEKMSGIITVDAGQHITNIDFGLSPKASLRGLTWLDKDANGAFENGDRVLGSLLVRLYNSSGNLVDAMLTDTKGEYVFTALTPGKYRLAFLPGGAYRASRTGPENQLPLGQTEFDIDIDKSASAVVNAGFYRPSSLAGRLWLDLDFDGVSGTSDAPVEGTEVQLIDCAGTGIQSQLSGPDGSFLFTDLIPGEYSLCVENVRTDIYIPKEIECMDCFLLEENSLVDGQDFMFSPDARSLSIIVYTDLDTDNALGQGDALYPGMQVGIYTCENQALLREAVTGSDGRLVFEGLTEAEYYIQLLSGPGWEANNNTTLTEDNGLLISDCMLIDTDDELQIGLLKLGEIGDYVWHDENENGRQDPEEMGVEAIELELLDSNGDIIERVSTDPNGYYHFNMLRPGEYTIQVSELESLFDLTETGTASVDDDSDFFYDAGIARSGDIEIGYFDQRLDIDLGLTLAESMKRYVVEGDLWQDDNGDALRQFESGLENLHVRLYNCSGQLVSETETDASGHYRFDNLEKGDYYLELQSDLAYALVLPSGQVVNELNDDNTTECFSIDKENVIINTAYLPFSEIGDLIWLDEQVNGQQDPGEQGVGDVLIHLLDEDDTVVMTARSGTDGMYQFLNVLPGTYRLELIDISDVYIPTLQARGDDETDSELRFEQGRYVTEYFQLEGAMSVLDLDMGINYHSSIIGGTIFIDDSQDGIRNGVEKGLSYVGVHLYTANGQWLQSTAADIDGIYVLYNVFPGDYFIEFDLPDGYVFAPEGMGGDELFDSDVICCEGRTSVFTISGSYVIQGVNAGLIRTGSCVSGLCWEDSNQDGIYDSGIGGVNSAGAHILKSADQENAIEGIVLELYTADDVKITETQTAADGRYILCDVEPGLYYLKFELLPGFVFSPALSGSDALFDSDVSFPDGRTEIFELKPGDAVYGMNAGMHEDMQMPVVLEIDTYTEAVSDSSDKERAIPQSPNGFERIGLLTDSDYGPADIQKLAQSKTIVSALYPNPTAGEEINLQLNSSEGPVAIRIYDASGRPVWEKTLSRKSDRINRLNIPVMGWAEGHYVLQLTTRKRTENHRFVIVSP